MGKQVDMTIKVIAEEDSNKPDGVSFHLENECGDRLETVVFDKTKHGMHHEDEHLVRFKLIKDAGMTLEFAPKAEALWVAWGTDDTIPECPKSPVPADPIVYAEHSNGNTLTVVNKNPAKRYFSFSLNFVDPHSTQPNQLIRYDPVGDNQNGGIGTKADVWSAESLVIGAVALVAVAGLAYAAFAR